MTDVFSDRLTAWRDYTSSPWARVRYAVVEETLRRETSRLGTKLRILDVGGGDGMDALPLATAGHDVTVLDQSRGWLDEAERRAEDAGVHIQTLGTQRTGLPAAAGSGVRPPSWRQRLRTRSRSRYEEDGVFRPVRLPLWLDLAISSAIVAFVAGTAVSFFVWLAHTQ